MKWMAGERGRRTSAMGGAAIFLVTLLAVSAAVLAGCGAEGTTTTKPESTAGTAVPSSVAEDAAPDFTGVTLDGVDVSLSAYRGRPLVLAFMASW